MNAEKSLSMQPMLVAHPANLRMAIIQTTEGLTEREIQQRFAEQLSQLDSATMTSLKTQDFAVQQQFIKNDKLLHDLFKRMEVLEVEGKYFQLHKSPLALQDRPRTDKAFGFHISHLEGKPELEVLKSMCRLMTYIPFELNAKQEMQA